MLIFQVQRRFAALFSGDKRLILPQIDGALMTEKKPGWYYSSEGKCLGPVSSKELRQLVEAGRITADDLIRKEGMTDWVPAGQVKGLIAGPGQEGKRQPSQKFATDPSPNPSSASPADLHPKAERMTPALPIEAEPKLPSSMPDLPKAVTQKRQLGQSKSDKQVSVAASEDGKRHLPLPKKRKLPWAAFGCLGVPLLLLVGCISTLSIYAYIEQARFEARMKQEEEQAEKDFVEAQRHWDNGNKELALPLYKKLISDRFPSNASDERPTVYQRVIEEEIKRGNLSAAKQFLKKARRIYSIELVFIAPEAKSLLEQVDNEIAEQKKKDREQERKEKIVVLPNGNKEGKLGSFYEDPLPIIDSLEEGKTVWLLENCGKYGGKYDNSEAQSEALYVVFSQNQLEYICIKYDDTKEKSDLFKGPDDYSWQIPKLGTTSDSEYGITSGWRSETQRDGFKLIYTMNHTMEIDAEEPGIKKIDDFDDGVEKSTNNRTIQVSYDSGGNGCEWEQKYKMKSVIIRNGRQIPVYDTTEETAGSGRRLSRQK